MKKFCLFNFIIIILLNPVLNQVNLDISTKFIANNLENAKVQQIVVIVNHEVIG